MSEQSDPLASVLRLVARLLVAGVFLWHGVPKAIDPAMAAEKFAAFGLPGPLGPAIGVVEVNASALLLGWKHRWAAGSLAVVILGALLTVQIPGGVTAGLERDLLVLVATAWLAVEGSGRFALDRRAAGR